MLSVFLLCLMPAVHGQDEVDSAWVMGMVYNMHNGRPMPYCTVSLLRGDDTVAVARTDENGEFMMGRHSTGEYRMQVRREFALYTMDLGLYGDALLSMAVDTVKHVDLVPVNVVAHLSPVPMTPECVTLGKWNVAKPLRDSVTVRFRRWRNTFRYISTRRRHAMGGMCC